MSHSNVHFNRKRSKSISDLEEPAQSPIVQLATYFVYLVAVLIGLFYEVADIILKPKKSQVAPGYAPLVRTIDSFYTRHLYTRIWKTFNNVITGPPGGTIEVIERKRSPNGVISLTDKQRKCVNLGSYNYLGFADDWQSTCRERVVDSLNRYGVSALAASLEGGKSEIHAELERKLAEFLGKESCMVYNMGYNTNASTIPALFGKGCLLISDTLNHASIVNGSRASCATIRVFRHNDTKHLEEVLRHAIVEGQPLTNRPWKKIMVMVEGIYSMEGEVCELAQITAVAKKYKAYVYVDEAHSIGALGPTGRGITEYANVNPKDIDILMGTFSKSFGAMGGYVAGSKNVVDHMRAAACGSCVASALSPVVAEQILTSLRIISGEDGTNIGKHKLKNIRENCIYFRRALTDMGMQILGDEQSPVVPMMLYVPTKIGLFHQMCMERGLAIVTVGFPAVPLNAGRARFCVSSAHSREDLDFAIDVIREVGEILRLAYNHESW